MSLGRPETTKISAGRHYGDRVANGRAIGRFEALLGVVGLAALFVAYSVATGWKPLPKVADWLDRHRTLAEPAPAWTARVGDQPSGTVVLGASVVLTAGHTISAYRLAGGALRWTRSAPWSAVAGSGASAVVVAGRGGHGYDAVEADTGTVRWSDPDSTGAWTFTDLVVGLSCPGSGGCRLVARWPGSGAVKWETALPGDARPLDGANHALVGTRPLAPRTGVPGGAPPLLGLPIDDQVVIVDTTSGARLRTYHNTPASWAAVAGDRVVVTSGNYRGDRCHPRVEGHDPGTGRSVWQRDGYDLHTGTALGCDQRTEPSGAGGLLLATGPDGREVLLDAGTGAEAYRAGTGEKILDTDGATVLVRGTDHSIRAVDPHTGATRWQRPAGRSAEVVRGPGVAVITDPDSGRLVAVSDTGQVLVDVKSGASVLGYAPAGLIVHIGRDVGLVNYQVT